MVFHDCHFLSFFSSPESTLPPLSFNLFHILYTVLREILAFFAASGFQETPPLPASSFYWFRTFSFQCRKQQSRFFFSSSSFWCTFSFQNRREFSSMDTTVDVKTPPSRHYFYRKVSQPDQSSSQNNVLLNSAESANIFENRVADFVNKSSMQSAIANLRTEATQDLNRRKADRRARKEREEQLLHHSTNNHSSTHSLETPTDVKHEDSITTFDKILFEKLNTLTPNEQNAWLANTNDNSLLVNPHQWLKLASLFNVNSKVARQQTLLNIASSESVLQDRSITKEEVKPLENFLELRDIQNRNYARDA